MKRQLLLLVDVDGLGRSGDIVTAKAGYIRNFLLPQKKAVEASPRTLKMQAELKEEREKRAVIDRNESERIVEKLKSLTFMKEVKVDPDGNMYGSVSAMDLIDLFQDKGIELEKKNFLLGQPIRELGMHTIRLRLKEGIQTNVQLEIQAEGGPLAQKTNTIEAQA